MPDNTLSTLEQIRIKVRRLTRSPSVAQIADGTINNYINTFILYDFPEHLRTFTFRTTLSFYTEPFVDTYSGDDIVDNFNNLYINVYDPVYVSGYRQLFSQDRDSFFALYPKIEGIRRIGKGDNATANYTGTLTGRPVLRNHVSFTSMTNANVGLEVHDVPNDPNDGAGTFAGDIGAAGTINYTTGVYDITFNAFPGTDKDVNSHTVIYEEARPKAVLYHHNEFTFRPVPDQSYRVSLEVARRPTEMINNGDMPEISQFWQYIAYGAAKKIFEDRMDVDSVQLIMPEFKKQEALVNRRTIVQQSKERTSTIYTEMSAALTNFFKD